MRYLKLRGERYHFRKRLPTKMEPFFSLRTIEVSLDTDSLTEAQKRAVSLNQMLDELWLQIGRHGQHEAETLYKQALKTAKLIGFSYQPIDAISNTSSSQEIVNRILVSQPRTTSPLNSVALGLIEKPEVVITKALEEFFKHETTNQSHKSVSQMRKWRVPRQSAIETLIEVIGDKPLEALSREDILNYRQWWVDRMSNENIAANTINKQFGFVKKILETSVDNYRLDISIDALFRKIKLKQIEKRPRASFEPKFVQELISGEALNGMNFECRMLFFAMADTGARISELVGLKDEDVVLTSDRADFIPHICIRPNDIRHLKTKQSERYIPLVGSALYAFSLLDGAFEHYHGKPDTISSTLNKYARENSIFPSPAHSLYSLRHCFEDRLTAIEPPDKVQAALMGHSYHRPRYGNGPSLEQKQHWLEKIAFIPPLD